ncbi:MAG TPA: ABC transporter ATP-binding protein [Jiangellaceae bacterium]|nr:ABC transporter ATP-binding protein [Jiangellaceae bacterium]
MSLKLNDVTLTYPDGDTRVHALDAVSLTVERGQLHAVVGPSGSGKSSLLAVAATLIRPDHGQVDIGGVDAVAASEKDRTRMRLSRVGIVFQQPNLLSSLTVLDQLLVTEHMRGQTPRERRNAAYELLCLVGLEDKAHRHVAHLSGGERQRVNIARALMGEPALLLVDEPTAALDHDRGARIVDLVADVTGRLQVATVMVTHDTEFLDRTDVVSHMRDGRLTS